LLIANFGANGIPAKPGVLKTPGLRSALMKNTSSTPKIQYITMSIAEPIISATTVWSLAATVALLAAAYGLSIAVLPRTISKKERGIYIWHIFDALTHLTLEASFCYYSLFSSAPFPAENTVTLFGNSAVSYGVKYSSAPLAKLWQEYARADLRWGNSDVPTLCIELITVVLAGPLALWVAEMIRKGEGRRWFWMAILATAEIYGMFNRGASRDFVESVESLVFDKVLNIANHAN
jgi:hypothetical protein